jgi:hypothetical protein
MLLLLSNNNIKKVKGKKERGFVYEVCSFEEYEQLKLKVSSVLDDIVSNLKENKKNLSIQNEIDSSLVVQSQNEPLQASPTKKTVTKKAKVHTNNDTPPNEIINEGL